jgi:conjugal transfer mating pair stabilization protein TraG
MILDYWTFGNADAMLQLLNATAAITGQADYASLIRTGLLLGFLVVVIAGALKADPRNIASWFIVVTLGWYVLMVPRVTLAVTDHSGGSTSVRTVGNVPLGLGFIASASSQIGRWLTQTAETVFALPDSANFINGGLMAPHRLSLATLNYSMVNETLANDWMNFFRDCTYYDVYVYNGRNGATWAVSAEELANSPNPLDALGKTNNAMFVHIITGGGPRTLTCREAFNALRTATEAEAVSNAVQRRYALKAFPGLDEAQAVAQFQTAVADAQQVLVNAPIATHQLIVNRWVHNLLRMEGTRNAASQGNTAQAMIEFGAIQSEQARLNSYLQSARAAHDTVPGIRNILEAVLIGLFPVVLLVMVVIGMQGMRAFLEWAMLLFSLQLWGFCYALMNYFLISKTSKNVFAVVNSNGAADVSLATLGEVAEEITADMAMAGTMVWAIPLICYGLTRGVGMGMMGMATRLAAPAQSSAQSRGDSHGGGEMTSGVGSFAKSSMPNRVEMGGLAGSATTFAGGGGSPLAGRMVAYSGNTSAAAVGLSSNMTNSATLSAAASTVRETGRDMSVRASESTQAALGQVVSTALKQSNTMAMDKGWERSNDGSFSAGQTATQKIVDSISQTTGASQDVATKLALKAGMGGELFSVAKLSADIGKTYGAVAQQMFSGQIQGESGKTAEEANKFVQTLRNSESARHSVMGGREASKGVDAKLSQGAALEQGASAAFRMADRLDSQAQASASGQSSLSMDLARVSPQLAQQISETAQRPDFQTAIRSGDVQGATQILASSLSTSLAGSPGTMNQILDAINQKPSQPPQLSAGPGGAPAPTEDGLRAGFAQASGEIRAQGNDAITSTWAERPKVQVGGPSIGGFAGEVQAGQGAIQGAIADGKDSLTGGKSSLESTVRPELPSSKGGAIDVPQSQLVRVSQSLGNDAANTANGVIKGAQDLAGKVVDAAAGPVGELKGAVEHGSQTVLREGMQAPGRISPSGPSVTFPYNAAEEHAQSRDPMAHVNKMRAEKGLPPLPSPSSQIPGR